MCVGGRRGDNRERDRGMRVSRRARHDRGREMTDRAEHAVGEGKKYKKTVRFMSRC